MSLTKISSYWNGVYRYNAKIPSLLFSGSLFRSGSRFSYFGSQVQIWADIYTGSVNINNLEGYEMEHRFVINAAKHPHEGELENNRMKLEVEFKETNEGDKSSINEDAELLVDQKKELQQVEVCVNKTEQPVSFSKYSTPSFSNDINRSLLPLAQSSNCSSQKKVSLPDKGHTWRIWKGMDRKKRQHSINDQKRNSN